MRYDFIVLNSCRPGFNFLACQTSVTPVGSERQNRTDFFSPLPRGTGSPQVLRQNRTMLEDTHFDDIIRGMPYYILITLVMCLCTSSTSMAAEFGVQRMSQFDVHGTPYGKSYYWCLTLISGQFYN